MIAIAYYNSLDRFPTWMWIRDDGYTLVLGAPDDSYVFYTLQFPIDRLLAYPLYVLAVLFVDALILFCMCAVARRRAQRAVKPVTEALVDRIARAHGGTFFRGRVASRLHGHGDAAAGSLGALARALNKLRGAGDGAGIELAPPRGTPEAG